MKGKIVDIPRVIELYKQGLSMGEVGRRLGHDHSIIAYHLYRNGIPIRGQTEAQTRPISTQYLSQRYQEGASLPQLSEEVGLSDQAIYQRLIKAGVKTRTPSEALKVAYLTGRAVALRGDKNPLWRGGRTKDKSGYVWVYQSGGKRREHHLVWEAACGEILPGHIIHHLNGIRDDNRLENLVMLPRKRHSAILIIEPYRKRILQLEAQVKDLLDIYYQRR